MALLTRASVALLGLFVLEQAAGARDGGLGEVVGASARVCGTRRNAQEEELHGREQQKPGTSIFENMTIYTDRNGGARILINTDLPHRKGVVVVGSLTEVELTERSLTMAGSLKKLSWLVKLGQFRLALQPRDPNDPPGVGETFIYTPAGDLVRLTGTDVAVELAPDGTLTVWVIEGEVEVTAAKGGSKRVPARHRTRVLPGFDPEPPVPFVTVDGHGRSLPIFQGDRVFPDPPGLDLRRLRLDLPQ